MKQHILIGCGSNLKNPVFQLSKALVILSSKNYISLKKMSPVYLTEPLGYQNQAPFYNCVISVKARVTPHALLKKLLLIEKKMGRLRTFKNSPRIIDLDLLLFRQERKSISRIPDLSLPHPEIVHRKFVLQPMLDLDTHIKIPGMRSIYFYLRKTHHQKVRKTSKKIRLSYRPLRRIPG